MPGVAETLESEGRAWFRNALSVRHVEALDTVVPLDVGRGLRLAPTPEVLRAIDPLNRIAREVLPGARPVRLVAFDKTKDDNWALPWHQDRVIAVRERWNVPGFSNWTRKDGVWHVEPPEALLTRMIFLRAFIDDDAGIASGGLMVSPGTHAMGVIPADLVKEYVIGHGEEHCRAERGDVLAAKALLLHRSRGVKTEGGGHRRAMRVDYSVDALPEPLHWEMDG